MGDPGTVRPEADEVTDLFNHAEVYHVAPNVEICPADVSDLMMRHDQPDLGGSLSWLTNNVQVFVALQQTAWSKRCTSAFSSGPGRDADVFFADSVHVHCLDKLKCSVYFNFIDNVDKLAKVI